MKHLELLDIIQKACLPGVWSKGVALARTGSVIKDSVQSEPDAEMIFRIRTHESRQP